MMRKILVTLMALLTVMWGMPNLAFASQYKGYWYGAKSPQEIADLVEKALKADPTGRTMLDAAKCRSKGSCAAPINYLESFQAHDPHAGLKSVSELPKYLRRLVIKCDISGEWEMDRIVWTSGPLGRSDINGMHRSFKKLECAWVNPDTGFPVLAENCANPVGIRINIDCVYTTVEIKHPKEVALIWARYNFKEDQCFAYRKVTKVYETDTKNPTWIPVPNGCLGRPCDLSAVNRILGDKQVAQGEISINETGFYQFRLSKNEHLVLCLKWINEKGFIASSFASGVRWPLDYKVVEKQYHARVYYESKELTTLSPQMDGAGELFFWASSDELAQKIRKQFRH